MPSRRSEAGQASAEFVALLPAVCLVVALVWQCVLVGHSAWTATSAARVAARAAALGDDPRGVVPRRVRVRLVAGGGVEVRVPLRGVLRAVGVRHMTARAAFAEQER